MLFLLIACYNPCPKDTTLEGSMYWGSVSAPSDEMSKYTTEAICVRNDGKRHGPAKGWFENGQLGMDARFSMDVLRKSVFYDAWGHESDRFDGKHGTKTFWTEEGEKVLEGRWTRRSGPDGTWTGSGAWEGTATYERGVLTGGQAPWGPYLKESLTHRWPVREDLPKTSKRPPSLTLAVAVDLTEDGVSIDGEQVLSWGPEGWKPEDLRGQLVAPVYDRLRQKAENAEHLAKQAPDFPFKGEWNLFASADTPITRVQTLLFTAKQAGFKKARAVVDTGVLFPPRYGPPALRGGPGYGMVKLVGEPVGPTLQHWIEARE